MTRFLELSRTLPAISVVAAGLFVAGPAGAQPEPPAPPAPAQGPEARPAPPAEAEKASAPEDDPAPQAPAPKKETSDQPAIDADDERPVPDYDGRGDDPTTAGEVLLWVPRVILSPVYLVTEYVIRRPLGWFATAVEKEQLFKGARDLFTFGPDNNIAVIPTGLIDFGFRPSIGAFVFWNDFLAEDNDLRLRAAYGFDGLDWWTLAAANRIKLSHDQELSLRGSYIGRSDFVFYGLGPSAAGDEARYSARIFEGGLRYEADLTACRLPDIVKPGSHCRTSQVRTYGFVRDASFDLATGSGDEPTVAEEIADGRFAAPPGSADGYTTFHQGLELVLDSRLRRYTHVSSRGEPLEERLEGSDHVSPPGTGVKLALRGEHAAGLRRSPPSELNGSERLQWVKYGATLGGFVDLTGEQRVVGLSLIADFADPLEGTSEIPFTEQVQLGGARPLRGFLQGRLIDRSSAVARLEYRYPIWVWLDGALHYSVGNVFGKHLDGFEAGLLRQSFGLGFRTTNSRDNTFEVLTAFGTETFDDGGGIDNFRLVIGTASGF